MAVPHGEPIYRLRLIEATGLTLNDGTKLVRTGDGYSTADPRVRVAAIAPSGLGRVVYEMIVVRHATTREPVLLFRVQARRWALPIPMPLAPLRDGVVNGWRAASTTDESRMARWYRQARASVLSTVERGRHDAKVRGTSSRSEEGVAWYDNVRGRWASREGRQLEWDDLPGAWSP
jgi:hypothetical protein